MAWPRIKNSRSSAQPGSDTQATVAPAPDAEPPPGSGQNAGVSGATHAVADNDGQPGSGRGRRRPPIRYAHSAAAAAPLPGVTADSAPPPRPAPAASPADYDQTAGLVFEAPHPAPRPDRPPRPSFTSYDDAHDDTSDDDDAHDTADNDTADNDTADNDTEPAEPADEGLAIFGGVTTTEATDSAWPSTAKPPPPGYAPRRPPSSAAAGPQPAGAAWNQPFTPAPRPVGDAVASRPRPFGSRVGGLAGGSWRRGPAPGPGGSKASIRDLPPDVRVRFWRLRITLMIVVGLLFGILLKSLVIGLTLGILAGIIDTGYRSWNAANYANGASQSGAHRRTRRQLGRLRRSGYFTLDARPIPNSPEVIDHLVVGPTGVYAIDSEKWNPKVPIRTLNGKKLYHGPESQKMRLEHAVWEAQQASEVLSAALGSDITVRPALAIYGPKIPWAFAEIRGVDVFSGPALRKYFRRRGRMRNGVPKLTREQVRTIYDTASRLMPDISASRTATPVG